MTQLQLHTDQMLAEVVDGIGWMTFNNPARRNALSSAMREAIPEILSAFGEDDEVRVVVMRGAGDQAFVSGADISEFEERRSSPETIRQFDEQGRRAEAAYAAFSKPLIAMIRGFAMGGGLLTALRADLRIAADGSQFGIPAARLGLGYGYGGVRVLVDLVGPGVASEILLTGGRFDAQRALEMGLVNRVVPPEELEPTVREMAATIADNAPLTVRALKATIREAVRDAGDRDMERVEDLIARCFSSQDYIEGRRAFMEKRRPQFQGR